MSTSTIGSAAAVSVTVENFVRAESHMYFGNVVRQGGFGKFYHYREPMPIDEQNVVRANRDTLYSAAVFDLDLGPVTIELSDAGKRLRSLFAINEDEYVPFVAYDAGEYALTKEQIGTRYVAAAIRTLVDPESQNDIRNVHALQDAIEVRQTSPGSFEIPNWDQVSQKTIRDALLVLGATLPDLRHAFGTKDDVDPVRHLVAAA